MNKQIKKIALLIGGGDCPGINSAIRAITKTAILKYGYEVIGYTGGFLGLYKNEYIKLNLDNVSGILRKGGSILYTSNKDNLFHFEVEENGVNIRKDVSDVAIENLRKNNVDALIVLGGDKTLINASRYIEKGVNLIGIPKTIDNDIIETDVTFGFNSALKIAVQALDRLHTTAEAHHRVMILEVMGNKGGWIALESGIAGSADVILIPEIPYNIHNITQKIEDRKKSGKFFTIIVVAEGAVSQEDLYNESISESAGQRLTNRLQKIIKDQEIRCTVLGHTQRGGDVSIFDRLLATRIGVKAIEVINEKKFGNVLGVKGNEIVCVPFNKIVEKNRFVNPSGELVRIAKELGIVFGD